MSSLFGDDMELMIEDSSIAALEMKNAHKIMLDVFQDSVCLEKYHGPSPMSVFGLEYNYISENYKIIIESERNIIVLMVKNNENELFYPSMIYKKARYYHYSDSEKDVFQLIDLTYKSIIKQKIIFLSNEEINKIYKNIRFKDKHSQWF
mgnify:FL=1